MPAKTKAELTAVTEKEWSKLAGLLAGIDDDLASAPHPDDGITIRDTVIHRAHWIDLFLGWYRDGKDGGPVAIPAPGYKWSQLKDYNARLRDRTRDIPWDEAVRRLTDAHETLVGLLTSLTEDDLYGPKRFAWTGVWTLGRYAEASAASHYRSAAKYIRAIKRKVG